MIISSIKVEGLFGIFNHTIPLDHEDGITIIHGANGLGKTMMLRMTADLISTRLAIFEKTVFSKFTLALRDGRRVVVDKMRINSGGTPKLSARSAPQYKVSISLYDKNGKKFKTLDNHFSSGATEEILDGIDHLVPSPYGRYRDGWRNNRTGEFLSFNQIVSRFPQVEKSIPTKYRDILFPSIISDLEVFFIESNRLVAEKFNIRRSGGDDHQFHLFDEVDSYDFEADNSSLRVSQYSQDVIQKMKSALADYARYSQESDRTFPERLVNYIRQGGEVPSASEIVEKMNELEDSRQRLITLGVLDSEKSDLQGLTEDDVKRAPEALTIYVRDIQKKISVFDKLAEKIGTFINIINDKFKYKKLSIDRRHGFRLRSESGVYIDLESLSSGEQHELVLLYELLFQAPENGLVLVDEPEISLHAAWQSRFLIDLMRILKLTGSYAIVATHSPIVIGERWDLTVELKGPTKGLMKVEQ